MNAGNDEDQDGNYDVNRNDGDYGDRVHDDDDYVDDVGDYVDGYGVVEMDEG